jgi:type IV pilus assembly protein PilC
MATFAFSGRTRSGENVTGERIGDTMDAVRRRAASRADQVTRIQPAQAKQGAVAQARKLKAKKVPSKNLAVFTRQFSVMIDAGLPLVSASTFSATRRITSTSRR